MSTTTPKKGEGFSFFNNNKTVLLELYKKEKERIDKEIEDEKKKLPETKEKLMNEIDGLFYNTENLQKPPTPGFQYKLEPLEDDNPDHEVLQESLNLNKSKCSIRKIVRIVIKRRNSNLEMLDTKKGEKVIKMYRVTPNNEASVESASSDCKTNILLLQGTKGRNIEGILKEGFRPLQSGAYGPGVYLNMDATVASGYGACYGHQDNMVKAMSYLFVNKVKLPGYKLHTYESSQSFKETTFEEYLNNKPGLKIFNANVDNESTEKRTPDKYDSDGNKIVNGKFQDEILKTAVAHHDDVVPAYLIEIAEKQNVEMVIRDLFGFRNNIYNKDENLFQTLQDIILGDTSIVNNCSFEEMKAKLERGIDSKLKKNLDLMQKKKHDAVMKQLLFKVTSLFNTEKDTSLKYKLEYLQKEDKDHQFILRSLASTSSKVYKKILFVFKVSPVDETGTAPRLACLYLNGMKSNKIFNVLKTGYADPEDCEKVAPKAGLNEKTRQLINEQCSHSVWRHNTSKPDKALSCECVDACCCYASNDLEKEIHRGSSPCVIGKLAKRLSFVFLAKKTFSHSRKKKSFPFSRKDDNESSTVSSYVDSDSRGSYFYGSSSVSLLSQPTSTMEPQYLVVFEL